MAITNESVTVATCDACGTRKYGDPGKRPAVFKGVVDDDTAEPGVENVQWAACGAGHVGKAIQTAVKTARDHARVPKQPFGRPQQAQAG